MSMSDRLVSSSKTTSSTTSITTHWNNIKRLISLRGKKGLTLKEAYTLLDNGIISAGISASDTETRTNNNGVLGNKYLQKHFLEKFIEFCNVQSEWRCMYSHPTQADISVTKVDGTKKASKKLTMFGCRDSFMTMISLTMSSLRG